MGGGERGNKNSFLKRIRSSDLLARLLSVIMGTMGDNHDHRTTYLLTNRHRPFQQPANSFQLHVDNHSHGMTNSTVTIKSISMLNLVNNVSDDHGGNQIHWAINGVAQTPISIPPGNYDLTSYAAALATQFDVVFGAASDVSIVGHSQLAITPAVGGILTAGQTFTLYAPETLRATSGILHSQNHIMGLNYVGDQDTLAGGTALMPTRPVLSGPLVLGLACPQLAEGSGVLSTSVGREGQSLPLAAVVQMGAFGDPVKFSSTHPMLTSHPITSSSNFRTLDFRFIDHHGFPVSFPDNTEVTMEVIISHA